MINDNHILFICINDSSHNIEINNFYEYLRLILSHSKKFTITVKIYNTKYAQENNTNDDDDNMNKIHNKCNFINNFVNGDIYYKIYIISYGDSNLLLLKNINTDNLLQYKIDGILMINPKLFMEHNLYLIDIPLYITCIGLNKNIHTDKLIEIYKCYNFKSKVLRISENNNCTNKSLVKLIRDAILYSKLH